MMDTCIFWRVDAKRTVCSRYAILHAYSSLTLVLPITVFLCHLFRVLTSSVLSDNAGDSLSSLLTHYKEVFGTDLGCVKGVTAKIQLKSGSTPQFRRYRPVPLALKSQVEGTLEDMVRRGTLVPVRTSSWASPMVTVAKADGSVRLCTDYTQTLSNNIDVEAYPLPHPEDLFASLAGNNVFSKLDLRTCFEQFQLDENAKEILTANTINGLMQYQRLPYGIASAPAIVQRAMEEILHGLDVCIYLDDLLIASKDLSLIFTV